MVAGLHMLHGRLAADPSVSRVNRGVQERSFVDRGTGGCWPRDQRKRPPAALRARLTPTGSLDAFGVCFLKAATTGQGRLKQARPTTLINHELSLRAACPFRSLTQLQRWGDSAPKRLPARASARPRLAALPHFIASSFVVRIVVYR